MINLVIIVGWTCILLAAVGSMFSMAAALVSQMLTVGLILLVGAVGWSVISGKDSDV